MVIERRAIIEAGIVTNLVVGGDQGVIIPYGTLVEIGYTWDGQVFAPPQMIPTPAQQKEAIERQRDAACEGIVVAHGRRWQADKRSRDLLLSAIVMAQAGMPLPPSWRDEDNDDMPITSIADLLAIAEAMRAQILAAYQASWDQKAAVGL